MAIDNQFMIQKFLSRQKIIAAFCGITNMPLLVCDPDSYNDQVWVFENENLLKNFAAAYTQRKVPIRGAVIPKNAFKSFYTSLYLIGANELVYMAEGSVTKFPLEDVVKKPDYSSLPEAARPVENPELQLTGLYFLQEFGRQVPNEEKQNLQQLDEEFSVNMVRARYILGVELKEGPGTIAEKMAGRQYSLPILKGKNGDVLQPVFSDMIEFSKFRQKRQLNAIAVPFSSLRALLIKDAKGFILNPGGFHAIMPPALLDALAARFPEEAKKGVEEAKRIAQTAGNLSGHIPAGQGSAAPAAHSKVKVMPGTEEKQ